MIKSPSYVVTKAAAITTDTAEAPAAPTSALAHFLESHDASRHDVPASTSASDTAERATLTHPSSSYPKHPDRMLPAAAAAYLGVAPSTLAVWRSTKRYPLPYIKVGSKIYYSKRALDAFLVSRTVTLDE